MAAVHALFALIIGTVDGPPPAAAAEPVRRATLRSGTIGPADYPASALAARAEGTSVVSYVIGPDGRVTDCGVIGSSGNAALDSTGCPLVRLRFRFSPAVDAAGNPTSDRRTQSIMWRVPSGTPVPPAADPASR